MVGNKADLTSSRSVKPEEAAQLARDIGARYMETSARTNCNVYELFSEVVHSYLRADDCSKWVHRVETARKLNQKRHSDDPQIRLKINNSDCLLALKPMRKKRLSADTAREMHSVHSPDNATTQILRQKAAKMRGDHQNEKCVLL